VRNYLTAQLTENPERESVRGSFVLASIRKGLRRIGGWAAGCRERDRARVRGRWPTLGPGLLENSLTLSQNTPHKLTTLLLTAPEGNHFIKPACAGLQWMSLMTTSEHGIVGSPSRSVDASYLADAVILLRRFEAMGAIRTALSVVKKRYGNHEKTIRELLITNKGMVVGQPLTDFQGVLTGEPVFVGPREGLMERKS
jgi:hypothetical protein